MSTLEENYNPNIQANGFNTNKNVSIGGNLTVQGSVSSSTTNLALFDIDTATPLNGVTRIRTSDWNFISNSSFESWTAGTSVAPDNWTLAGTATITRSSTSTQGTYSALLTFGAAADGELYSIFSASNLVDYTFSAYVTRTSGSGGGRMVLQQNFGSFTEDVIAFLPTGAGQQLVTLSGKPSLAGNYRINFKANGSAGSTWRIDEVKVQESKNLATTYTPNFIDDSFVQNIYAEKTFYTGMIHKQIATPNNPPSGFDKTYFKSDDKLYKLTSAGVETLIG